MGCPEEVHASLLNDSTACNYVKEHKTRTKCMLKALTLASRTVHQAWACDRSLAGIVGSNPVGEGMFVLCVV